MNRKRIIKILLTSLLTSIVASFITNYIYFYNKTDDKSTNKKYKNNIPGKIDKLYAPTINYSTMNTRVTNLETDANIKIKDYSYNNQAISTSGTGVSYTLPSGCTYDSIYSVDITWAWPRNNWTNGAVVSIAEVRNSGVIVLTTNSAQNYNVTIRLICKYR